MDDQIRFTFRGCFDVISFEAFARHRAARLGLKLALGTCDAGICAMTVTGQPTWIDAFEMAMSLGPRDCLVLDVERVAKPLLELVR